MNSLKNLIQTLKHLKNEKTTNLSRQNAATKVLEAIYVFGINPKVNLDLNDQLTAGTLIKDVVKDLDRCIFNLGYNFDPDRGRYNLVLRSGIQFLLDDLNSWPVSEDEQLEPHLKVFVDGDSLETFDEAIQSWREDPQVLSLESITHTEEELKRPPYVPTSHTWWF